MAKVMESTSSKNLSVQGTARFISPEAYLSGKHTFASDIFSLGMTIYEIIEEKRPFSKLRENVAVIKISEGIVPKFQKNVPIEFKEIFKLCTYKDPSKRATTRLLLQYMNSKQVDFIQNNSDFKGKNTLLNLDYFVGKVTVEKKKVECSQCFDEESYCYETPKCKHYLCEVCIINNLIKLKKRANEKEEKVVEIRCKNGCKEKLSFDWIIGIIMGTKDSKIIAIVKEIEKCFFFVACVNCKTLNDKRLVGEKELYSKCKKCGIPMCKECSHKFIVSKKKCSFELCDMSGSKYDILKVHEKVLFPFPFNEHPPGKIPFVRLCPTCGELNYRINDINCKHCIKCAGCGGAFCFICLCVGTCTSGSNKVVYSCGEDPWGYCDLAPFQTSFED